MDKVEIEGYEKIPLEKIYLSEDNVRKSKQRVGLEALKVNIKKINLISPVIVIEHDGRFELIAGQRRYWAFKELNIVNIPALIIGKIDSTTKKLVSFSENLHRTKLPYNDTIEVCEFLFKQFSGTKSEKVEKIAKNVGIPPDTVARYLSYLLIPKEVRQMVEEDKLSRVVAYKITSAFWPNKEKIIKISKAVTKMTSPEWERVFDIGKSHPESSVEEVIEEAKKPPKIVEIKLVLTLETIQNLEKIRQERKTESISELIKTIIEETIGEEVILDEKK